jgi:multisubunit Na+/H+ antiporter MnhB subunit
VLLLATFGAGVGYAVLALPQVSVGLGEQVDARLIASGVENPVTAVLMNFRGYDTLLEIAVLSLAIVGIWSMVVMPRPRADAPALVLVFLVQVLAPFMILLGGYLLWAGSHLPGGAFQAGAVFAAAMVLLSLAGAPLPGRRRHWPLRLMLLLGLTTFAVVGIVMMFAGRQFLEFPAAYAGHLILLIEAAAAVSIGLILAFAFRGGRPPRESGR